MNVKEWDTIGVIVKGGLTGEVSYQEVTMGEGYKGPWTVRAYIKTNGLGWCAAELNDDRVLGVVKVDDLPFDPEEVESTGDVDVDMEELYESQYAGWIDTLVDVLR